MALGRFPEPFLKAGERQTGRWRRERSDRTELHYGERPLIVPLAKEFKEFFNAAQVLEKNLLLRIDIGKKEIRREMIFAWLPRFQIIRRKEAKFDQAVIAE